MKASILRPYQLQFCCHEIRGDVSVAIVKGRPYNIIKGSKYINEDMSPIISGEYVLWWPGDLCVLPGP